MRQRDRQTNGVPVQAPFPVPAPVLATPPVPEPISEAPAPESAPVVAPWLEVVGDRINLTRPMISLQGSIVIRDARNNPMQPRELIPEFAYIAGGVLVIEEMNLWFPLASIHYGRKI